jgi:hypothetical protein
MIAPDDPGLPQAYQRLYDYLAAHGVEQWLADSAKGPNPEGLVHLCKFGFFTALLTKAEIGKILKITPAERKQLVKGWYDDHRAKGCGTC